MQVAYLASEYPAVSHTFIKREVDALRKRGVRVDTFSVRLGSSRNDRGVQSPKGTETFTILSQPPSRFVTSHLRLLLKSPTRYAKTFQLALQHRPPGMKALFLSLAHFVEAGVLANELNSRSLAHLHTHFANSGATVGLLASRLAGITWSFVVHGPSETDYPAGYLLGKKVEAADMVVCVSWFAHSQAMRLVGFDHWRKFRLVRCGLPLNRIPERSSEHGDSKRIICVGRLCSDKAQAGLLLAFQKVRERHPTAELRFIGDGPSRGELESLAHSLGVAEATVFLGSLPEDQTLGEIASAGMMVLPSFWEGLPVALMEAMASGVPVITSRIAGVPELVRDGENGLLFAPANWSELAAAMERLLEEPAMGERLALAARKAVEEQHDITTSAELLERYFGEIRGPGPVR